MSSQSHIDLMPMFQQDQESVLHGIQKFAKEIFDGNDEEAKEKLCKNLHEITNICHCSNQKAKTQTLVARKRSEKFENEPLSVKKKKLECKQLPYELWLKIMNYLNTKDLFTNMALVCKNFNSLTNEVKYLELKEISELEFESAINLLKTTTHLKEISLSTKFLSESKKKSMKLLLQALTSSKSIKSIKLQPFFGYLESDNKNNWINYKLGSFKQIKKLCPDLEHLHLRHVIFSTKSVISQIAQFSTLKSLRMSLSPIAMDGGEFFTPENILEFSNCPNLEAISLCIKIGDKNFDQMKKVFDTFFNAKKHTLKRFEISRFYKSRQNQNVIDNNLLENIILCQNLEELSIRDFKIERLTLADILILPNLTTLVLQKGTMSKAYFTGLSIGLYLGRVVSMVNLKYLKLGYNYNDNILDSFTMVFTKIKFPVLERFALDISNAGPYFKKYQGNIKELHELIANSPKLKSIQLLGEIFHSESYKDLALQSCKEENIFVTFGTFARKIESWSKFKKDEQFQNDFESKMETVTKIKYDNLKRKFLNWEKMNNWWTWAVEDN